MNSSNPSPVLGDLVITTIPIQSPNTGSCIPANTIGVVCGRQSNGLIQVDFGEDYGSPKFLNPVWVEVIDSPDASESLGETLFDLVVKLSQENKALEAENQRLHESLIMRPRLPQSENGYYKN